MIKHIIFVILILLNLTNAQHINNTINVNIYTKSIEPFTNDKGVGFTTDIIKLLLESVYGKHVNTYINILNTDNEIFEMVKSDNHTINNYAIGGSAIPITAEKEKDINFLPSYFTSGFKLLVKARMTLNNAIEKIVVDVLSTMGVIIGAFMAIVILFAPTAYFFEFAFTKKGKIPIFIDWNKRKNSAKNRRCRTMTSELFNAIIWTIYTLCGVETGYPESKFASLIHKILKISKHATFVVVLATMTAVINKSLNEISITNYADLKGNTVCTVTGTSAHDYINTNNVGFTIVQSASVEEMFDSFWNSMCDAIIYDYMIISAELMKNKGNAYIIGNSLNEVNYGIIINKHNNNYELLKQGMIELKNDYDKMNYLKNKYFERYNNVNISANIVFPKEIIIITSAIAFMLLIVAFIYLIRIYDKKNKEYIKARMSHYDSDYTNDIREIIIEEGSTKQIYVGMDNVIDKFIAPYVRRILRVVYEIRLTQLNKNVDEIEKDIVPLTTEIDNINFHIIDNQDE